MNDLGIVQLANTSYSVANVWQSAPYGPICFPFGHSTLKNLARCYSKPALGSSRAGQNRTVGAAPVEKAVVGGYHQLPLARHLHRPTALTGDTMAVWNIAGQISPFPTPSVGL